MFVVVLLSPQLGENIGACARAMKNFGISELRIVNPRDGWPNPKAEAASVGAIDIIQNATVFLDLESAVSDFEFIYATTGAKRSINKSYVMSKNLKTEFPFEKKVGILFGRENSGLNNEEISIANKIITINTNKEFTSLNIGQAVLAVCYELFEAEAVAPVHEIVLATKEDIVHFHKHLFSLLEEKGFFKVPEKMNQMQQNIINIFSRIENFSRNEVQTLRGIIKALEHK